MNVASDLPSLDDVLGELARSHRVLAMEGLGFGTTGSVSLRDPAGRGFWTKRSGIGLDEVFGPAELVLIDFDGKRVAGSGGRAPLEWPIRVAIFKARPDVNAVVYLPSLYATVFSSSCRPVLPAGDEGKHFDFNVPTFGLWTGWFTDPAVCEQLAIVLGDAKAILLKNNGLVTVGPSLPVAVLRAIFLENACRLQLAAETSRYEWGWVDDEGLGVPGMMLTSPRQVESLWDYYLRRLERLEEGIPLAGDFV